MSRAKGGEGSSTGREAWDTESVLRFWGVYPLSCFYWQRLPVMKCKQHQSQIPSLPAIPLPPPSPDYTHVLSLTVLGYSFWCCCSLACLVSGLHCLQSYPSPPKLPKTCDKPLSGGLWGSALSPLTCAHYKNQWINIYMQKYLTTKKKQMYNVPLHLYTYLPRGSRVVHPPPPVCTHTLDYWYVFQQHPLSPRPCLCHGKFAFYASVFFPFFSHSSSCSLTLNVVHFIHQWIELRLGQGALPIQNHFYYKFNHPKQFLAPTANWFISMHFNWLLTD